MSSKRSVVEIDLDNIKAMLIQLKDMADNKQIVDDVSAKSLACNLIEGINYDLLLECMIDEIFT